jgi:hypothetical protein
LLAAACSDDTAPIRFTALTVVQSPSGGAHNAEPLWQQPVLQLTDANGALIRRAGVTIRASVSPSSATLAGDIATTDANGRATFSNLAVTGALGTYQLHFSSPSFSGTATSSVTLEEPLCVSGGVPLDMPVGGFVRFTTSDATMPRCLEFHADQNNGQQYLVMLENIPRIGDFKSALYPTPSGGSASASTFETNIATARVDNATSSILASALRNARLVKGAPPSETHAEWDFGAGAIREGTPPIRDTRPMMATRVTHAASRGSGMMSLQSAVPSVGDTIQVQMEGIARLNIDLGAQHAVVKYVGTDLIIAEDVRLGTTLVRPGGGKNTPLTVAQMDTIAREYAAYARVQGDRFFGGRYNTAVEAQQSKVIAIHSLTYDNRIWGYTYPNANYFVFDYWVGTNGSTAGNNQILQRVADDLFMHEIAHIRHWGLLERAKPGTFPQLGNQWMKEGFARFTERMPIAMRLLGNTKPSRTSNFVLAKNAIFNGSYFFDDVPTYLDAGSSMFDGYQSSSFVFDYLSDQVALRGGDYEAAVRDLITNGGSAAELDAAVARWLPGVTFGELMTRARVALYADDYAAGLPAWTQYSMYDLRASRPPGSRAASDPRNAWPKLVPGATFAENRTIPAGGAYGYIVDGASGSVNSRIVINATSGDNGIMSITRIQ